MQLFVSLGGRSTRISSIANFLEFGVKTLLKTACKNASLPFDKTAVVSVAYSTNTLPSYLTEPELCSVGGRVSLAVVLQSSPEMIFWAN